MSSYIKSELYRIVHHKWTYFFIAICSLLLISSNVVLAVVKYTDSSFPYATTDFSFSNLYSNLIMVYLLCIAISNMIFGNEHNNHTMKNSVSYGISRGTIYFGKLLVQIIYAILAFAIIVGIHVISGYLLLENSGPEDLSILFRSCLACLPLFIFGLATMNCFVFILEGGGAIGAACGIMIVFPLICNLLGMRFEFFTKLGKLLPWNIINSITFDEKTETLKMYWDTATGFRNCWMIGISQMLLITMIGFVVFRKKEIK